MARPFSGQVWGKSDNENHKNLGATHVQPPNHHQRQRRMHTLRSVYPEDRLLASSIAVAP